MVISKGMPFSILIQNLILSHDRSGSGRYPHILALSLIIQGRQEKCLLALRSLRLKIFLVTNDVLNVH
jgi:hypothetical protein